MAKAARAAATPLNQHLPSLSAKLRRLGIVPAARRNLDPKTEIVSRHVSGLAPTRVRIGARSASMNPRLSDRIILPDLSTRSRYSVTVICRIPRRSESDWIGHSQEPAVAASAQAFVMQALSSVPAA